MMNSMKKVLMIAFHYPPEGGSGMQRTLKFSKYLPDFGYTPYILTVKENVFDLQDKTLLKEIPPEVKVIRANCLSSKKHFSINRKYPDFLSIPDDYWTWIFDATRISRKIIKSNQIDAIYSTSPIHTAHLIALILKRIFNKPWVADFRDPWMGGTFRLESYNWYRSKIESWMEKQVIINCDKLICNTNFMEDDFLSRYPDLSRDKLTVIPNGYDEKDFHNIVVEKKNDKRMTFIHMGEVYSNIRSPLNFLKTVKQVLEKNTKIRKRILIRFIGGGPYLFSKEFSKVIRELKIKDYIEIVDHVPHSECINLLSQSDVLLLLQQSKKAYMQIPAKTYEYLRAGKPILAICDDGATADLIKGLDACLLVKDRSEEIGTAILELLSGETSFTFEREGISQYERKNLTKKLVKVFNELVN